MLFCVDFLFLMILLPASGFSLLFSLVTSVITSLTATFAELAARKGYDTISVPLVAAIVFQICMAAGL